MELTGFEPVTPSLRTMRSNAFDQGTTRLGGVGERSGVRGESSRESGQLSSPVSRLFQSQKPDQERMEDDLLERGSSRAVAVRNGRNPHVLVGW